MKTVVKIILAVLAIPLVIIFICLTLVAISMLKHESTLWSLYDKTFKINYSNSIPLFSSEVFIIGGSGHRCRYVSRWFFYSDDSLPMIKKYFETNKVESPIDGTPLPIEVNKINPVNPISENYSIYYKNNIKHTVRNESSEWEKKLDADYYYSATIKDRDIDESFLDPRCN